MGEHVYKLLADCVPQCHCSLLKKCEIVIVNVCNFFVEQINKFKPEKKAILENAIRRKNLSAARLMGCRCLWFESESLTSKLYSLLHESAVY